MYNILIVEDDAAARFATRKVLAREGFKITVAENGIDGFELIKKNNFEIIITDWLMPLMDGIELIGKIRSEIKKQPIIFLLTAVNSAEAREKALFAGADEYLTKPISSKILIDRIEQSVKKGASSIKKQIIKKAAITRSKNFFSVGIAASTGGPSTLVSFFSTLGILKNAAILIVLHGPKWMLESFVFSLQEVTEMPVHQGSTGMVIKPGHIYLAPGNMHMVLKNDSTILELLDTPPENFVKPSADPLFRSIASSFGNKSIGIVFTGMGKDGAYGTGYINAVGGKVIVQDPRTAILSSMPKAVIEINMADEIVPLNNMSQTLKKYLK
ncbi:MAG: chemotaxis protein CheB [Melioribacteraceae bacterium]|nr:chemotaxis protein CheB [Melioribacteraceae bacterium]